MKSIILGCLVITLTIVAYFLFWPVPIDPVAWDAPPNLGYTGSFKINNGLSNITFIGIGNTRGPEDIARILVQPKTHRLQLQRTTDHNLGDFLRIA